MSDYKDLTIGALRAQIAALEAENATLRADWEAEDDAASKHMGMVKSYLPSAHHAEEIFPYIDRLREREAALAAKLHAIQQYLSRSCTEITDDGGCLFTTVRNIIPVGLSGLIDNGKVEVELARVRREAKRKDLRKVKTAAEECIKVMLFESSGRHDRVSRDSYCEGVQDVIADIDAALAALDAEEKEAQNG